MLNLLRSTDTNRSFSYMISTVFAKPQHRMGTLKTWLIPLWYFFQYWKFSCFTRRFAVYEITVDSLHSSQKEEIPPGNFHQRGSIWAPFFSPFCGFTKTRGHDRVGSNRREQSLTISKNSFCFVDLGPKLSGKDLSSSARRKFTLCVWSFVTRSVWCHPLWISNGSILHNRFLPLCSFPSPDLLVPLMVIIVRFHKEANRQHQFSGNLDILIIDRFSCFKMRKKVTKWLDLELWNGIQTKWLCWNFLLGFDHIKWMSILARKCVRNSEKKGGGSGCWVHFE